jgi:hypothetical protein
VRSYPELRVGGTNSVEFADPTGGMEARIAIMTYDFSGTPMQNKGFERREREMSWHIITHNLWLLAGMEQAGEQEASRPLQSAA